MELTQLLKDNDLQAYYNRKLKEVPKPKFHLDLSADTRPNYRYISKAVISVFINTIIGSLYIIPFLAWGQATIIPLIVVFLIVNMIISIQCPRGVFKLLVQAAEEYKPKKEKYLANNPSFSYSDIKSLEKLKEFIDQDIVNLKNELKANLQSEQTRLRESVRQLSYQISDIENGPVRTNLQAIQSKLEAKLKSVNDNLDYLLSFETSLRKKFKFIPHLIELIKANELISEIDQSDDLTELIQSMINTSSNDNSYKELLEVYL